MSTRIAFVTGHEFGRRALEGLLASDAAVEGAVSCELLVELDSSRTTATVGFTSTADLAAERGIEVLTTTDGSLRSLDAPLREVAPHFLLVIGWSRLVAAEILDLPAELHGLSGAPRNAPSHGCIGMHPTRLPTGRGQAPIPWTIIRGLTSTALSVFNLEDEADTGSVIDQLALDVRQRETAATLFSRFADLHFHAGLALARPLADRGVHGTAQDDSVATRWPKRRPSDGRLSLEMSADDVDRVVRALLGPYPRAHLMLGDEPVRVVAGTVVESDGSDAPGVVRGFAGQHLMVTWGSGDMLSFRVDSRDVDACLRLLEGPRTVHVR